MPVERVVEAGGSGQRNVLADDAAFAALHAAKRLLFGKGQAMLVVLPLLALLRGRVAPLLKLFLGAKARISRPAFHQLHSIGQVQVAALRLDVRAIIAAHIRPFVVIQAGLAKAFVDQLHRALDLAFLIGVLNAAVFPGEQVRIQGGTKAAKVQIARRAWGEAGADHRGASSSG